MVSLKYAILIPCYNEAHRIRNTVLKTHKVMKGFNDYKIYVINDGSTDNIQEKITLDLNCELISFKTGPSRRENLSIAIRNIKCDVLAFMDADLSTNLNSLPGLLKNVSDKHPIVIGDKYDYRSVIKRDRFRLFASKMMNWLTRTLFNTGLNDHFIGFKAFKYKVIYDLCDEAGVDSNRSMFWDAEILIRALRKGLRIHTIPVVWIEGKTSSLKITKDLKILAYLIMYRLRLWFKR